MATIINSVKGFLGRKASKWVLSAAAFAGLAGPATSTAMAHDRVNVVIGVSERCEPIREVRFWVAPQYRTVCDKVYIAPVVEERCEKIWVEPVFETRCEKFLVPEVVEFRESRRFDRVCGRWVIVKERVCVSPARYETRESRVMTIPGHFEEVRKPVIVTEGFYKTVERQELVCEGHWETRVERVQEVRPAIFFPPVLIPHVR